MITLIKGKILGNNAGKMTVLTPGGVGYTVFVNPLSSAWKIGQEAEVLTYLSVRENAMDLYGFATEAEKNLFEKFLLVSGIGPKTALHLLSLGSVEEIAGAINRGDLAYLKRVSGIGGKTAERLVVELKGKLAGGIHQGIATGMNEELADVVDGLIALGYSESEAREAVKKLETKGKNTQQLLKEALQKVK
ncbi:MAG TPA: Holliday junction branch migration protein RuvA [Patescibacteria group bacterium]|nr:Holliday junction branch migration protein RuvA [Patescibacteria group bacterium]